LVQTCGDLPPEVVRDIERLTHSTIGCDAESEGVAKQVGLRQGLQRLSLMLIGGSYRFGILALGVISLLLAALRFVHLDSGARDLARFRVDLHDWLVNESVHSGLGRCDVFPAVMLRYTHASHPLLILAVIFLMVAAFPHSRSNQGLSR
jgi:hypothetical protein